MGSGQSSSNTDGSFSVDANGNVKRHPTSSSGTGDEAANKRQEEPQKQPLQQASQQLLKQEYQQSNPIEQEPHQQSPSPKQLHHQQQQQTLLLDQQQQEQLLQRIQEQRQQRQQQLLGGDKENNLVQCYLANKEQPLNCQMALREYKESVSLNRDRLLRKSLELPLIIALILAVLLLPITTVNCYGAMSIDLGSEWMKVGLIAPSVQMDIVLNAQSQRKSAMAIAFSNGERFVGDAALDVASKYPEKTYTHFLDLVGKSIDHESVRLYKQRFPYAQITSHEPNSTSILLKHPDGLSFTPLELIAMMLEHAHDQVVARLNSNEPATDVVITVPPFFNSKERRVVEDAARLVGLNVLRLTNVNSAFALSYGIFRHKDYLPFSDDNKTSILFFDQGASHTSATVADYHLVEQVDSVTGLSKNESLPTVTIRAQVYDRYLGGFDMQLKLRDYLVKAFAKKTKIDEGRIFKRGKSAAKLLKESGRVKKVLSANTEHVVRVENVIDDKDLKEPMKRETYEQLNEEYLTTRITKLLDSLFELPEVNKDEKFESVIIVGGNTRTPKIQQVLQDYFKVDTLGKSINADEGAALSTLYQAASSSRGFRVKKFVLEEYGEERKRLDTSAPVTEAPVVETATTLEVPVTANSTAEDPNVIYTELVLRNFREKLEKLREQDFLRLQRLSLINSIESLLSEGKEKLREDDEVVRDKKDELEKLIAETGLWLEDATKEDRDNVTLLAGKFDAIHELVRPRPPPTLPPTFDPTKVDLSSVFNNDTLSILDALNFTNPFASTNESETENEKLDKTNTTTPPEDSSTKPKVKVGPPHSEL